VKPQKPKHRTATPALMELVRLGDKLAHYRATHRANVFSGAAGDERMMAELTVEDCTAIIELIEAVRADRNILDKYWRKGSESPLTRPLDKLAAATDVAWQIKQGASPNDDLFESVGNKYSLSLDQVKHTYRDYVQPAPTKNNTKGQSGK
jgi:hypothetical protein